MNRYKQKIIKQLAFHKSGKPRGWVRIVCFHKNKRPRNIFKRIVCKKSGLPRLIFINWMNEKQTNFFDCTPSSNYLFKKEFIKNESINLSISIVIPTYNRADFLEHTINAIFNHAQGISIEVIIVNDGSTDHTEEKLKKLQFNHPDLKFLTINNQGAGVARNHGAAIAEKDIILFLGDDILPAGPDFLTAHAKYHQVNAQLNLAVLGKVDWPPESIFGITPVMRHIQGPGGEQFGYSDMQPYKPWDWRFFYTCNVSIKRNVVQDWLKEGFSHAFTGCGFEDGEFAYRMGKKYGEFPVLYIDESIGHHYHRHTVSTFLRRQYFAGAMAKVLGDLHPEALVQAGFSKLHQAFFDNSAHDPSSIVENLALAESLFKWAQLLEDHGGLGKEGWHKQLLHCVFRMSAFLGYMDNAANPTSNHSLALKYIINSSCDQLLKDFPKKIWRENGFV